MVHSKKTKRLVERIYLRNRSTVLDLKSWASCKDFLKERYPFLSRKMANWFAHLLFKRINKKSKSVFEFYLQKAKSSEYYKDKHFKYSDNQNKFYV